MAASLRELMGPFADEAVRCIRCGFCNSVCPTTLTSIGYIPARTSRGRLVLLQSALEKGVPAPFTPRFKELINLCIGCLRCVSVCPARIPIPTVMSSYRYSYLKTQGSRGLMRGEQLLTHYESMVKSVSRLPPPLRQLILSRPILWIFKKVGGFADDAPIPTPEGGTLDKYFRENKPKPGHQIYAYFSDTFARFVRPSIGVSACELLEKAGIGLAYPRQYDSGVIYWELGLWDKVRELASQNVEALSEEVVKGRKILCTSPASTMMLRDVYPRVLDSMKSRLIASAVVDINELVASLVDSGKLQGSLNHVDCVIHSTCLSQHLHLTGQIVGAIETLGAHVVEVVSECCGSGGLWGLLRKNRGLSVEIGGKLVKRLKAGVTVLSYSETCSQQVESLTHGEIAVHLPHEALNYWLSKPATHPQAAHTSQAT